MFPRIVVAVLLSAIAFAAVPARGDPWLAPGDEGLHHDVLVLADAGILRGPVTTWPLSWPDIARDALAATPTHYDSATAAALIRVQRQARSASATGYAGAGIRVAGAYQPSTLRSFADTPREEGELALRASWLGNHLAWNAQAAVVTSPEDGKTIRPDGSYLGVNIGNFMISAGYMQRWWGPGWDGGMILTTNARPIPSVTLERNYTDPWRTPLLAWLGPWRASIALGEAESHGVAVPDVKFMAARVNFRPRPWLEFGLSRTAQWCGGDRDCGWGTFTDMLLGRDNQVDDGDTADQPGNQMAGYDMRLRSPWKKLPLAFYTQWIGEDEAGGLPSKFIGMFGLQAWGSSPWGGWRLRAEYADTACSFTRQNPQFDCAYRNSIYPQGYTYRGRNIGSTMDNDSRQHSFGGLLARPNGDVLSLTLRRFQFNRDGSGDHAISAAPRDVDNVELRYSREVGFGKVSAGLGYGDPAVRADADSRLHGFVVWQQGF